MPEYLFFRPPRRQPRILAVSSHANRLAMIVLDPWEMRYIADTSIPLSSPNRQDACQVRLQECLVRERPQTLVVLATRSTAREVARQLAKHFDLPLVELSPQQWQQARRSFKREGGAAWTTFFKHLPERHVSKRLFENTHLLKTALLAHIALSALLKTSYDAQPKIELEY